MKEVEVKIQVGNIDQVLKILEDQGFVFGEPITQRDVVYIPNDVPTVPAPAGTNVLRLRYAGVKTIFTLKRSDAGNHLSKLELESEVSNPEQLGEIIKLLGFKIITDTTKTRQKSKKDNYEVCLDRVEGLGDFLEIEKMTAEDPALVQQEMINFLKSLGINTSQRMDVGYDVLWVQKYGKV